MEEFKPLTSTKKHPQSYYIEKFHHAIRNGRLIIVDKFLEKKIVDINCLDVERNSIVHNVLECCDIKTIKYILDFNLDINMKNINGDTPLMLACVTHSIGHPVEVIQLLLNRGADINVKNHNGTTALMKACTNGNVKIVEFLLKNGAANNINEKNKYGDTALTVACIYNYNDNIEIVKLLLNYGADIMATNNQLKTAVHILCNKKINLPKSLTYLLECGAKINVKDYEYCTPLHLSCYKHNFKVCKFLLSQGADIKEIDKFGNTPLHCICSKINTNIIKINFIEEIFKHDIDYDRKNINGKTALDYVFGVTKILRLLIHYNCSFDYNNNYIKKIYAMPNVTNVKCLAFHLWHKNQLNFQQILNIDEFKSYDKYFNELVKLKNDRPHLTCKYYVDYVTTQSLL